MAHINLHNIPRDTFDSLKEAFPWGYHKVPGVSMSSTEWLDIKNLDGMDFTIFPENSWSRKRRLEAEAKASF